MLDNQDDSIDARRDSGYSSEALSQRIQEANRIVARIRGTSRDAYKSMLEALFDIQGIELGLIFSSLDAYTLHIETLELHNTLADLLKSLSAAWIVVTTQDRRDIAQRLLDDTWYIDMRDLFITRLLRLVLQETFDTAREACLIYLGAFLVGPEQPPDYETSPWLSTPEFQDVFRHAGMVHFTAHAASEINSQIVDRTRSNIDKCFREFGPFWWTFLDFNLDGVSKRKCSCLYIGTTHSPHERNCRDLLQVLNMDIHNVSTVGIVVVVDPLCLGTLTSTQRREMACELSLMRKTYARVLQFDYTHHADYRKIKPGSSISDEAESNSGTLCLILAASNGQKFGLTCGHVLLNDFSLNSKEVYAPAIWDQLGMHFWTEQRGSSMLGPIMPLEDTKIGGYRIGDLTTKNNRHRDWCLFRIEQNDGLIRSLTNDVEVLEDDLARFPLTWPTFTGHARITGLKLDGYCTVGETLIKIGAVTNKTKGIVNSYPAYAWFAETAEFVTRVLVGDAGMVDRGDSGSVIVQPSDDGEGFKAIGMVFGMNRERNITLFTDFSEIWTEMESALGMRLSL